jgi:hypothetical protein
MVLYILWTLQKWVRETDLATTYLLDITSERRNGPHSSLTGGIVWAGALSNCKTSTKVTKNTVASRTYTAYFLLTQIYIVSDLLLLLSYFILSNTLTLTFYSTLNVPHITKRFPTLTTFVTVQWWILYTGCLDMITIYVHTKFQMCSTNYYFIPCPTCSH